MLDVYLNIKKKFCLYSKLIKIVKTLIKTWKNIQSFTIITKNFIETPAKK